MKKIKECSDPLKVVGRARGYSKKEIIRYIPRHANFSPYLLKQLKDISDVELRNLGTLEAKKFVKMMREVSKEAYRAKQFTRTEINDRGVLYGIVALKHDVIDVVLNYFHKRWPRCIICLYNENTKKTNVIYENGIISQYNDSLSVIVNKVSENRPVISFFSDIQFLGNEIFKTLYESQHISERKNSRYFKSMIPDYCFKLPGMRKGLERRFSPGNKKIDDYF
ncbi:MAG: DUF4130 domain-containing protein [Promethearchaeota archaeon]